MLSVENKNAIIKKAGCVELLVAALKAHVANIDVLEQVCIALGSISANHGGLTWLAEFLIDVCGGGDGMRGAQRRTKLRLPRLAVCLCWRQL